MEDEGTIARNVRRRMAAKGLGPKALSRKAGLNETYVRDLLKGRSLNPRQAHLQNLAVALDCRVSDLTDETDASQADATLTDEIKRELLEAYESADENGRNLMRLAARTVRRDSEPEAGAERRTTPKPAAPTACVVKLSETSRGVRK